MANKVSETREEEIERFAQIGKWDEKSYHTLDLLLNQEFENGERRAKRAGVLSYNRIMNPQSKHPVEWGDTFASSDLNPEESLIFKEEQEEKQRESSEKAAMILEKIDTLAPLDKDILFGIWVDKKKQKDLAAELGMSTRTIRRHCNDLDAFINTLR
ncbi:sigma-70 family RNA polymerase sigma factor [Lactococcus lactis]|uniref:Uncharacterized protein n=1 Tax=Lactococcus lactis subsp. lactis A12 TaxID=1137134 RepID=S6F469_LACLL|nr:sigma-70 family RNA polymerase sigma factor [Lactococcus lactis]CDG03584.1 Putative uncharacterized protein, Sigma-70 region 4 superfamily protein [Lactococcus lactis subsp. lactis A12]SBW31795.1 Putative uncharacterized protein, Sigma-70 region 4 superfamily protein [Lactococcus lactis subsp. lactis]